MRTLLILGLLFGASPTFAATSNEAPVKTIDEKKFNELSGKDYTNNIGEFKDVCYRNGGVLKYDKDAKDFAHQWRCEFIISK